MPTENKPKLLTFPPDLSLDRINQLLDQAAADKYAPKLFPYHTRDYEKSPSTKDANMNVLTYLWLTYFPNEVFTVLHFDPAEPESTDQALQIEAKNKGWSPYMEPFAINYSHTRQIQRAVHMWMIGEPGLAQPLDRRRKITESLKGS